MSDASSKQPVIPADWDAKPLSWAISGLRAGVSVNSDSDAKVTDGRPSVLKTSAIFAGRLNLQERKPIIAKDLGRARSSLQAGTILISRMNTPALVGECGYVATDEPDVFLPDRIWMTEFNAIRGTNSRWLASVLSSSTMRSRLKEIATGTSGSMKNIAKGALLSQEILFPPPKEQEAIAEALSDAEALIEGLERLIAKKRLIKQGAMQDLLTAKRRLPGFSGEWAERKLGTLLTVRHGRSQKEVEVPSGQYPILATGGQIGTANSYLWDKPSVLIGRKGTIDRPQFVETPFWTVDTLFYTDIQPPNDPRFIFYVFQRIDWQSYNEASGVPSLNAKTIENINVFVPGSDEQIAISAVLKNMDAEIQALETRLEKARQVKEGMMQNLLTGRIRLV